MKLITIGIPTYNRAHILNVFFEKLFAIVIAYPEKIEIIISDNCSIDNTNEICKKNVKILSEFCLIKYIRNKTNIGISKNITSLIDKSSGEYFILLGDDDYIEVNNFSKIIKILESKNKPSAIIQGISKHKYNKIKGYRSYLDASRFYYEYGNCYYGIINSIEARKVLNDKSFRRTIEQTVWPQTAIGFIVIANLKKDIYVTDYLIGGPLSEPQTITNKSYWTKSLESLLRVSIIVDSKLSTNWTRKAFVNDLSIGFVSRLNLIVQHSFINNTSSINIQRLLNNNFGLIGFLISKALIITDKFPITIKYLYIIIFSILKSKSPFFIYKKLKNDKIAYFNAVNNISISKKRFADSF